MALSCGDCALLSSLRLSGEAGREQRESGRFSRSRGQVGSEQRYELRAAPRSRWVSREKHGFIKRQLAAWEQQSLVCLRDGVGVGGAGVAAAGTRGMAARSSSQQQQSTIKQGHADVSFREAREEDMGIVRQLIFSEFMNPLSLDSSRFIVAELAAVSPISSSSSAAGREEQREVVGAGQVKVWRAEGPGGAGLLELRSLVVAKHVRGHGIGTKLVERLLASCSGQPVHLLTIGRSISFYNRIGFVEVTGDDVPHELELEIKLGNFVAAIAAKDRCLCMKRMP